MATYFVGNVLPPTDAQTSIDDQDPTFRFSKEEAGKLNLVGKPIRCEHSASLKCGTITKQMIDSKTGKVYVIGKIDSGIDAAGKKNIISTFANKAIGRKGGGKYYGSLSLQHVHEETFDGKTSKKAIEVSLVNEPRRRGCDIIGVRRIPPAAISKRHAASGREKSIISGQYIGGTHAASREHIRADIESNIMTETTAITEPAPTDNSASASSASASSAPAMEDTAALIASPEQLVGGADSDGDFKMGDVVNVVLQQETELDRLKAQLAVAEKERDEHKTVNEARRAKEQEITQKKRATDTEKAEALMSTLTELWDETVPDSLWQDNKEKSKSQMKKLIEESPELAKDLFSVVHCASSRYATALNSDVERHRTLSSKLGHVMKKRKIHAASARVAEPAKPAKPAESQQKSLMSIMKGYSGNSGMSGTATSLMNRLYKQQSERYASPF